MTPISFSQQTVVIAETQSEYLPLPAYQHHDHQGKITCCWQLTLRERLVLLWTGRLWHSVLTFYEPLQPQLLEVSCPLLPR